MTISITDDTSLPLELDAGERETERRIQALEDEGLTRSDAQGVVLAEDTKERAAQ